MANPAQPAGEGGVSGATTGISGGDTAIRNAVSGTQFWPNGTYSRSAVYSQTKNLRFAYAGVDCDTPARDRS